MPNAARLALTALLVPLAVACGPKGEDASRFHGAKILEDGRTGLISYQRARNAPVESSGGLIFGGSVWGNVSDEKILATIDLETNEIEVLFRDERPRPSKGGNYRIKDVAGRKAMLYREEWRNPRSTREEVAGAYLLFDLDTREMTPIDTRAELEALGRSSERAGRLVHRSGVLLGVCEPAEGDPEDWTRALYVREPDGSYRFRGNERTTRIGRDVMLTWRTTDRAYHEVDLVTGETRALTMREHNRRREELDAEEKARPDASVGIYISQNGVGVMRSNRRPPPNRDRRPVEIDVDRLR